MSRKRRKYEQNLHPADGYLERMTYRDLKKECIARGMDFDKVLSGDFIALSTFFRKEFYADVQRDLLDDFDDYQENLIRDAMEDKDQNPDDIIYSSLRLGFIAEKDEDGNVVRRKRSKMLIKKKRVKRERTNDNIFKGTKKALTFELQQRGLIKEEVIKKVRAQFSDASEKSIGIWFNRSKKLHRAKGIPKEA